MIAIVYHFFAHYREPVLHNLAASGRSILLVGCPKDPTGSIKTLGPDCGIPFKPTWGWFGPGGIFIQPAAITTALNPRIRVLIYLGDAHFVCTWIGAAIGRLLGKRVLFWTHGYTHKDTGLKGLFRKLFYRIPHQLLLYGNRGKELALATGLSSSKLRVIYNSLDYDLHARLRDAIPEYALQALRQELFPNSDAPIVLFSARLTNRKRFDLGIEALHLLITEGHPVQLLVVGDGPQRADLELAAAQHSVPARFMGAVYDEGQLARCFLASTVVVSPGEVGLTAIHAMAYGRPVITHDNLNLQGPEAEAILEGITGSFFRFNDLKSLALTIRQFTQSVTPSVEITAACVERIRSIYNPVSQGHLILDAVDGSTKPVSTSTAPPLR